MENSSSTPSSHRHRGLGALLSWKQIPQGISGNTEHGQFKLSFYKPGIIRFQASVTGQFDENPYAVTLSPDASDFTVSEKEHYILLQSSELTVQLAKETSSLSYFDLEGNVLNEDDPLGTAWIGTEVNCYKKIQEGERFLGLGEKTGGLDRRGRAYTNWNTDYFAYGVEDDPLYLSIPFYLGVHAQGAYGIFFDNPHKSVFNFGASTNRFVYFGAEDGSMDYYFIHRPTLADIISDYTLLTGRMELPPKWSLGFQQCRYSYYPDSEVTTVAQTFRDKDLPADVIYLDIHHMEAYKVFTFDSENFPDPKKLIESLRSKGFRVVVIMDPGIKVEATYSPYLEGRSKDLFVKYPDGDEYQAQVWPGWCAFPDFTKEQTRNWWAKEMKFYEEFGVKGYWTDMNEPASWGQFTPNLIEFDLEGENVSHRKARNVYGMQMARSAQQGVQLHRPAERPFVLTRSGFAGIQRHAAVWTGDNTASEDHMLAGVRLVNSLGMSGVSFSGFDVGGFAGEASKSLFARWMSIGAFSPLFRAHSMINSKDSEPWAFGEEVEEISRNYMKLRYALLPTLYSKFYQSSQNGLPINQSLAIHYPLDSSVYSSAYQNQFLFCEALLVAPVESTKEITKVYLPEGAWYYFYTDQYYTGNQEIYLDCPLNYLPVMAKAGQILAVQSPTAHTDEAHDGILRIHLYRGSSGSTYIHYEDDGLSLAYQEEAYFKREIRYSPEKRELQFSEASGTFSSKFSSLHIYFHGFQMENLSVNGNEVTISSEDFAFLGKLTEFDPLPEHAHPFHQIQNLKRIQLSHLPEEILISGLF